MQKCRWPLSAPFLSVSFLPALFLGALAACGGAGDDTDGFEPTMDSAVVADDERLVPDVICPGAQGCRTGDGPFQVGAGMAAITPAVETWDDQNGSGRREAPEPFDDLDGDGQWDPTWMAGFDPGRAATGIHDDTWARALSLSRGDTRLGIVSLDLLGLFHDDTLAIREAAARAGLDYDSITVVATHTHETQDALGLAGRDMFTSGYDPDYIAFVIDQSVAALADAIVAEKAASLVVARGEAPQLVGDSRLPIVIDQSIHVLRFDGVGETIATLMIWGNHPEALGGGNTLISSDYPHYLRETLEAEYPGSTAIFIPGTLGGLTNPQDIAGCPDTLGIETCATGTYEKAEYVGAGVAQAAIAALASPIASESEPRLSYRRTGLLMTITNVTLILGFQLGIFTRVMHAPDGSIIPDTDALRADLEDVLAGNVKVHTEVSSITIGPLTMLTLPGEIYPELWLAGANGNSLVEAPEGADFPDAEIPAPLQDALPGDTVRTVVNQANDSIGYIIPKSQFDAEPPHAYDDAGQYGEEVTLGYEMAPEIFEAVRSLYDLELR